MCINLCFSEVFQPRHRYRLQLCINPGICFFLNVFPKRSLSQNCIIQTTFKSFVVSCTFKLRIKLSVQICVLAWSCIWKVHETKILRLRRRLWECENIEIISNASECFVTFRLSDVVHVKLLMRGSARRHEKLLRHDILAWPTFKFLSCRFSFWPVCELWKLCPPSQFWLQLTQHFDLSILNRKMIAQLRVFR